MIIGCSKLISIIMHHRFSSTYISLLIISLISSLHIVIVASNATELNGNEPSDIKSSDFNLGNEAIPTDTHEDLPKESYDKIVAKVSPVVDKSREQTSDDQNSDLNSESSVLAHEFRAVSEKSDSSNVNENNQVGSVPNIVENIEQQDIKARESEPHRQLQQASLDSGPSVEHGSVEETSASTASDNAAEIQEKDVAEETLPDIPANPAVITLGEKAPEIIVDGSLSDDDLDSSDGSTNDTDDDLSSSNAFGHDGIVVLANPTKKETVLPQEISPDEMPPKIDDSGGGSGTRNQENGATAQDIKDKGTISTLPDVEDSAATIVDITATPSEENKSPPSSSGPEVNLTTEENPIPVFSEWAQKRMEEAEKKLEKEVVNSSTMKKNSSTGNKPQPMKVRTKNYASPDCGAKIIASNSDAQNTGALLSATKDEYMLSPCTNRIWFVVELCEAIQAEKVELANFELFSSSPKNFSVAVSNRFPTREWSNVGRFVAEDQRNIQSFELHPHLFGKFVRVDIHSHYNSEHFCPISLFRVYGTSEFEAFETENRLPADDIDDFDDEEAVEVGANKNENNLFKSASDAVMSIVKKAAEALVKTSPNKTDEGSSARNVTDAKILFSRNCWSLRQLFVCSSCEESIVNRTNYLLSCQYNRLINLLSIELFRAHLLTSQTCAKRFNLDIVTYSSLACTVHSSPFRDEQNSFILNAFPLEYLAAICHILATDVSSKRHSRYGSTGPGSDSAMNLTIDQKAGSGQFNIEARDKQAKPITKGKLPKLPTKGGGADETLATKSKKQATKSKKSEEDHAPDLKESSTAGDGKKESKPKESERSTSSSFDGGTSTSERNENIETSPQSQKSKSTVGSDVNIFNIVDEIAETTEDLASEATIEERKLEFENKSGGDEDVSLHQDKSDETKRTQQEPSTTTETVEVENTTWDNIDKMLSEQVAVETGSSGNADGSASLSQQIPQRVHSESVFLRLSNRIKALERNMSLSGQYLEELSRRYKKQVEELQHSFAKTLASIDEQNRRAFEKEQTLIAQNRNLEEQLSEIASRLNNWIIFGICFFVILMFQTFLLWLRSYRENRRIIRLFEESSLPYRRRSTPMRKLLRRKSVEGVSGHPTPMHKVRRPSEEADRIMGSYKNLLIYDDEEIQNLNGIEEEKDIVGDIDRRMIKLRNRKSSSARRSAAFDVKAVMLNRQESAPGDFVHSSVSPSIESREDDRMLLEDDYESYMPGSDLAYNEFMPEGPSGSQVNGKVQNGTKSNSKKSSKVRRLSSPGFLKSTFNRSGSSKKSPHSPTGWEWYRLRKSEQKRTPASPDVTSENVNTPSSQQILNGSSKSKSKSKKSKSESPDLSIKQNGFGHRSSTPNSTISMDIMPATRIYQNGSDESMQMSDTSLTTTTGSILSNGNRGSSSVKKHGSFKKMWRKVF